VNPAWAQRLARRAPGLALVLASTLALAPPALAAKVTLPIELDFAFLRDTLVRQVYIDPGPSAQLLDDGHDCVRLTLKDPRLDARDGRLRIRTAASGRLGTMVLERCTLAVDWSGELEVLLEPHVTPGSSAVSFTVADSNVLRPDGSRARIAGALWGWIKGSVHPRLAAYRVDLDRPLADLRTFLPLVLSEGDAARTQQVLDSVALAGARIMPAGLATDLRFEVPEVAAPPERATAPEAPLGDEEIAAFEERLHRWDGFLTFVVKQVGRDTAAKETRQELLAILLDARTELVDALGEADASSDPVRPLFLATWARLVPVLRRLGSTLPGEESLRYLSFVTAADALAALDRIGPSAGIEISAQGLRRLARILAPGSFGDPLQASDALDPELRELFGFGEPIEPPPPDDAGAALRPRLEFSLVQRVPTQAERLRLRSWVPTAADLDAYLALVHAVLDEAADRASARTPLEPRFAPIYGWLVLAAAWKESCWRQFVLRDGKPVAIRSGVGAVGILQVSVRVWRGFYDAAALERDLPYNARAGAEILIHYLANDAIPANEHGIAGNLDALARATYAAYNGGPRALRRWRNADTRPALRKIDDAFWREYQAVKANGEPDRASCYGA
jgi:hypothetical protein